MRSSVGLHAVSHFKPQGLQNDKKTNKQTSKQKGHARNKYLVEISCENKVLIKSHDSA